MKALAESPFILTWQLRLKNKTEAFMIYVHKSKNISSFLFEQVENRNLIIVSVVIWIRWFAYEEFVNRIEALHRFFLY